jgi:ribosomal protein L17
MEKFKAKIIRHENDATLSFEIGEKPLNIKLTEEKPNEVKAIFNQLIQILKKGEFQFELEKEKQDLFFHISKEYITHLNSELSSVYKELKAYNLTED